LKLNADLLRSISGKKLLAGALILGLIVSVVAINLYRNNKVAGVPVKTAKAEIRHLQDNVFATGRVRLVEKQEFYSYEETTVKEILVNPGDPVRKGQVLGLLDAGDSGDKLSEAEANYAVQQSNLEDALHPRPEEIAQSRANYKKAEADYKNAQKELERNKAVDCRLPLVSCSYAVLPLILKPSKEQQNVPMGQVGYLYPVCRYMEFFLHICQVEYKCVSV